MKRLVVGLGELLWDVLPDGRKNLGGAPSNFAYHVAQFGLPSMAVSAIGNDVLGEETRMALKAKRLEYMLQQVPYPTGQVLVTLDDAGVPAYDIKEGVAWDNMQFTPQVEEMASGCRAVCFGSLAQRGEVSRGTIRRFLEATPGDCMRIFDINLRQAFYTKEIIEESMRLCNVLKVNDEELVIIGRLFGRAGLGAEHACRQLLGEYHLDTLILTCGVNGSYVFTQGKRSFLATPRVDVVDTVGAGDSFTGSFCAARLRGMSVEEAHRLAVDVSAYVCTKNGAMPQLPRAFTSRLE
ncbi:MAG: carbohydrate kinase [Prevotellaceae bacterium]|nr:carbohydrate kinase [Prevotellaceae bacterium]